MPKKSRQNAIPKRIAGVKVPKGLRKGLRGFLGTQSGRMILVEALAAGGAAMAAGESSKGSLTRKALKAHPPSQLGEAVRQGAGGLTSSGSAVAFALAIAARNFADALHQGKARADAEAAWPPEPDGEEATEKPRRSRRPDAPPSH